MNITLSQQDTIKGAQEFNQIVGFYLAYEEGATVSERVKSFTTSFPIFSKILDALNRGSLGEPEKKGVKKGEGDYILNGHSKC